MLSFSRSSRLIVVAAITASIGLIACSPAATPTPTAAPAKPAAQSAPQNTQGGTTSMAKQWSTPPQMAIDPKKSYVAEITTTEGTMRANLFADEAPKTVNNFVFLARENYYENVKFHRIIKGFMAQTGDPTGTGAGGPGYRFEDEPVKRSYKRGTLAMANAGPNTNGSQFFIMHNDYALQPNYTIFGEVTEGLDVLDKIAETPVTASSRGERSVPSKEIKITGVKIEEK
jgi:cyclophilin family peptidyl-prolyl cis-trans isomerase